MNLTRSELHKREKEKRTRKVRRLLAINLSMLGVLIVLAVVWLTIGNHPSGAGNPSAANAAKATSGGDSPQTKDGAGNAASGDSDGQAAVSPDGQSGPNAGMASTDPESNETASASSGDGDGSGRIDLAFVGDILLGASVGDMISANGYDYPYKGAKTYLSIPDITAANLEYPVTTGGTPAEDKQYVFKGTPEALPALRDSGIDVVTVANNHTMDQGVEGLLDTIKHLDDAGIKHTGAGHDDTEAFAPAIVEANGVKVAYIGLSKVVPDVSWKADKNKPGVAETYDTTRALAAIQKAKENADIVVVLVHWGEERNDQPLDYQRDFARQYIDAGADLIIGSHPHVLQGFEMYKGKWIAYSLGNFIFSAYPKGETAETGVLDAKCTKAGDCSLQFHPMTNDKAQPAPMDQETGEALLARLESISFGVDVDKSGNIAAR